MKYERLERQIRRHERPRMGALVDGVEALLLDSASKSISLKLSYALCRADELCASEIEKLFLVAWMAIIHQNIVHTSPISWISHYELVTATPTLTQEQAFAQIINTPPIQIAPDPTKDIGVDRIDYIFPQLNLGTYRADFVLVRWEEKTKYNRESDGSYTFVSRGSQRCSLVVIECDGHDFHEKTMDQAQRDKARDQHFAAAGFHVLRFTGAEIYRDAMKCAAEVAKFFDDSEFPSGYKGRRI